MMMKRIMNTSLLLLIITGIISFRSSAQEQPAEETLNNPQQRIELMKAISNDHDMMTEMMNHMMENDHAKQMMGGNYQMMQRMMSDKKMMMSMMEKDSSMAKIMMGNMMEMMENDPAMCKMIGGIMMNNKHMMDTMHGMNGDNGGMMKGSMMMCPMHGKMKMGEGMDSEKKNMMHHKN